jgi:hypothetical protein
MKKLFYILLIALTAMTTISSCTEEEVSPSTTMNGGGSPIEPK